MDYTAIFLNDRMSVTSRYRRPVRKETSEDNEFFRRALMSGNNPIIIPLFGSPIEYLTVEIVYSSERTLGAYFRAQGTPCGSLLACFGQDDEAEQETAKAWDQAIKEFFDLPEGNICRLLAEVRERPLVLHHLGDVWPDQHPVKQEAAWQAGLLAREHFRQCQLHSPG